MVSNCILVGYSNSERAGSGNKSKEKSGGEGEVNQSAITMQKEPTIIYGKNAKSISKYSETVLRENMESADVDSITVTSTYRSPADQARVMYQNLEQYGVEKQNKLYGKEGRAVIDAYSEAKANGSDKQEIIAAMAAKVESQAKENPNAFKHSQDMSRLNTVDIDPSSVRGNRKAFEKSLRADERIQNVFTPPKDPAIHVEIPQK